ncbi:MAG: pyridoxal phosphate-dependent aminotransferase [Candidatus Aminicenantes bacterium]|nr:pyridoxal phosphate-dependent aminotransferase [Candidatus Aminicenantes bacterium]
MDFQPLEYLDWAKNKDKPGINLTRSGLPGRSLAELGVDWEELALEGYHGHGYPPLIEAVAARYGARVEEVVTAPGTSMALFMVCAALLEKGDEALVEKPAYGPLSAVPRALGAGVRRFERRFEDGYRLDADEVLGMVTPRTRLIMLTDLHNPSGVRAGGEALRSLAEGAAERGVWLIVDEVYLEFLPSRGGLTAFGLAPNVVSLSSLTKVYGLGGLRRGWILAPGGLSRRLLQMRNYLFNEEVYLEEQISARLFDRLDELRGRAAPLIGENRDRMRRFMAGEERLSWVEPDGGVVCFPRLRCGDGRRLEAILRERHDTGVVPGDFFGDPAHVRIGFGVAGDVLERGLKNIGEALSYL